MGPWITGELPNNLLPLYVVIGYAAVAWLVIAWFSWRERVDECRRDAERAERERRLRAMTPEERADVKRWIEPQWLRK